MAFVHMRAVIALVCMYVCMYVCVCVCVSATPTPTPAPDAPDCGPCIVRNGTVTLDTVTGKWFMQWYVYVRVRVCVCVAGSIRPIQRAQN